MAEKCVDGDVVLLFKPVGVESTYVVCEDECSVSCQGYNVVTVDELLGDAEAGVLGEVVASLLVVPAERLEGDTSLYEEARMTYLVRVVAEEHARLRRLLRGLARVARAAHIYHVVSRVARLSRIYPWVGLSLVETLRHQPTAVISLARRALRELGCRGDGTWYEPCGEPRKRRGWRLIATSLQRLWPLVKPGAATHPLLRDPLLLVKLPRGRLRTKLLSFEDQLYAITGVKRLLRMQIEGLVGSVTLYRGSFRSAIVKRYLTPATAKWIVAAGLSLPIYPYRLDPRSRLEAEYSAVCRMLDLGLPVPEPLLIDPRGLRAAYEYIPGTPLHQVIASNPETPLIAEAAALIARIHSHGWVVGDTNPSNFIVVQDAVHLVDLEQARESTSLRHRAWDLAVLIYYSFVFSPREPGNRAMLAAKAYLAAGGERDVVREASKVVYALPFAAAVPINVLEKARRALHHVAAG